ncbi:hypothetical protein E2562_011034, partial [Oryza meyeriana var. granulata]
MRDPGQSGKPEASDSGTTHRHHALLVACGEMQYNRRHEHKKNSHGKYPDEAILKLTRLLCLYKLPRRRRRRVNEKREPVFLIQ